LVLARRSWLAVSAENLSCAVCSESLRGYRRSGFALLALFVLFGLTLIVLGAPPIAGPWDMSVLLDGAWRMIHGQVPHTDFHNPNGPLTYLLVAFGMKIATPSASSITYGIVLLAAFLLPLAWHIAFRRLPWAIASIFVLFEGFYLLTPRPPGYGIRETTYAMIYNREGYVLISLLMLCVFLRARDSARRPEWLDGLLAGVLLALLLYCKITYFLAAAALTLFAVALYTRPWRRFLACAGAFAAVCAALFVAFHINLYSYLSDIAVAGQSQSLAMRTKFLAQSLANNATWIFLLVFCLALWTWAEDGAENPRTSTARVWLAAGSIMAAALLINAGNGSQGGGVDDPLYFVAAVVFLEAFRRRNRERVAQQGTVARLAYTASLALLLPLLCGAILIRDMASSAYAVAWDVVKRPAFDPSRRLHSTGLRDFYVPASTTHMTAYWPARDYPAKINDGIDLLKSNLQSGDRVTTIAFANPFSFALGIKPARDGPLWWDLNYDFDRRHFPLAGDFLGDASLVMVPRLTDRSQGWSFETVDVMLNLYGDYLRAHFHQVASTDTWVLYRRNPES
jgi:hypothetical protein